MNWALRLGLKKIFHYMFLLNASADTGPVLECEEIDIDESDYISDLYGKAHNHVLRSARKLTVDALAGRHPKLAPQPTHVGVWLPKITPEDSLIEPSRMSVEQALNIVRATSRPFPGSKLLVNSENKGPLLTTVWTASPSDQNLSPGETLINDRALLVGMNDGAVWSNDFEVGGVSTE